MIQRVNASLMFIYVPSYVYIFYIHSQHRNTGSANSRTIYFANQCHQEEIFVANVFQNSHVCVCNNVTEKCNLLCDNILMQCTQSFKIIFMFSIFFPFLYCSFVGLNCLFKMFCEAALQQCKIMISAVEINLCFQLCVKLTLAHQLLLCSHLVFSFPGKFFFSYECCLSFNLQSCRLFLYPPSLLLQFPGPLKLLFQICAIHISNQERAVVIQL